ncbi:RidA family protein [Mariniblastus fucicola]|uniref:Endoribonuclease L-PSP n=1 Tax=Mariniblastus fucicola TaxID=980251 RepID=A0A5B9P5C0_9BACT|nr:RidA family protein [Mariniblastus fucicola]QEG21777.1 Endoribonuclease L-PSP [Mariniblastus fucicola]
MAIDERLSELGLELPPAPNAVAVYKPSLIVGDLCFTSGHLPVNTDGSLHLGCVGRDVDQDAGYAAAKQAGLAILATLKSELGSLDRISRIVKLFGMVNCTPEFTQQPAVVNGCSELMREVFGEDVGVGTRSAVGVAALPLGVVVEIEAIVEVKA